jgi:predicted anti-sigma-YlaC factor YlaD
MTALSCEQVRDLLPDWATGREVALVAEHLASCPHCRAEASTVAALRNASPEAPAGLEAMVIRAIRARPARRAWRNTRQLALAATLVGAVIGGSLLIEVLGNQDRELPPAASAGAGTASAGSLLPVLEDPALYSGSVLSNLTEAELESLLARMES